MEPKQWVGIDVSDKRLEVFVRAIQRMLKVVNSPPDWRQVSKFVLGSQTSNTGI
jgi:hypothetical protein